MTPRRDQVIVAATLDDVRDGSAIYLEMDSYVPSEICCPQNNKAASRLSNSTSRRESANRDEN
jgi:hypothetical protein